MAQKWGVILANTTLVWPQDGVPRFQPLWQFCIILQELSGICFLRIFVCICWDFWQSVCTDFGIGKLFCHFHYTAFIDVNMLSYATFNTYWFIKWLMSAIQGWPLSGQSWNSPFLTFNWSCLSSRNIHASSVTAHFGQTVVNTSLLFTLSNQELDDGLFLFNILLC
jgi:hypothetical protein